MQVFPRSGTAFIICDTTNPPTDDVHVRQALSMAIERDALANGMLKGEFTRHRRSCHRTFPATTRPPRSARTWTRRSSSWPRPASRWRGLPRTDADLRHHIRRAQEDRRVSARRLEADPRHQHQARSAGGQGVAGLVQLPVRPAVQPLHQLLGLGLGRPGQLAQPALRLPGRLLPLPLEER